MSGTGEDFIVRGGWLCEVVPHCTCGTHLPAVYGHEPGCGVEPIASVEQIMQALWQQAENANCVAEPAAPDRGADDPNGAAGG